MNTQNILGYYGTKLDLKLDYSEFYDLELAKNDIDYNTKVLGLSPIVYDSLKISKSLSGASCTRTTLTLTEMDIRPIQNDYIYSGLTTTLDYDSFVNYFGPEFKYTILNNNIFQFTGITNQTHLFRISNFNLSISINQIMGQTSGDIINGFSKSIIKCGGKLSSDQSCCFLVPNDGNKPWAYQFVSTDSGCTEKFLERRVEKGWTLDFIFNRESLPWSSGSVFYYFGVRGSYLNSENADNNLSFKFTSDGKIQWTALRYKNICTPSGTTESYVVETGTTPTLCTNDETKDFNVTIVFDRYKRLKDCDVENDGGWNDMLGTRVVPYADPSVTAVTSTQLTYVDSENEQLSRKWAKERDSRLGTLKIYLNGRPIYKIENWEEVVPSERGLQPFIQSWGGGISTMPIHNGVCCFNMKSVKYYEEPLDFINVRHKFLTRKNQYDFFICGDNCIDQVTGL